MKGTFSLSSLDYYLCGSHSEVHENHVSLNITFVNGEKIKGICQFTAFGPSLHMEREREERKGGKRKGEVRERRRK